MKLGIGSKVWVFDGNRRVYSKPDPGCHWSGSRLVIRACWIEHVVLEETRVSWGIGYRGGPVLRKVKKAVLAQDPTIVTSGERRQYALSAEEVDGRVWLDTNGRALAEQVSRTVDAAVLKRVAALVGYEDKPEPKAAS